MNVAAKRPTIAELKAILAAPESDTEININPDGSITAESAPSSPELAQETAGPAVDGW